MSTYLVHHNNLGTLENCSRHTQKLFFATGHRVSLAANIVLLVDIPSREVFTTFRDRWIKIAENTGVYSVFFLWLHISSRYQMDSSQGLILLDMWTSLIPRVVMPLTISASSYSLKTSRVERNVPLRIVGSSEIIVRNGGWMVIVSGRTRDDSQFASQVSQTDLSDVNTVNDNATFRGFDETEEWKSKRGLSGTRATQDTDLLSRLDLKIETVKDRREFRLKECQTKHCNDIAEDRRQHTA